MIEDEIQGRIRWSSVRLFTRSALQQRSSLQIGLLALLCASAGWSVVTLLSGRLADRILEVASLGLPIHTDSKIALYFVAVLFFLYVMYAGNRYGRMYINATLIRALSQLHEKVVSAVLHSPMSFFNENPSGRILSRFSNDYQNASQSLDRTMATFIYSNMAILFCSIAMLLSQPVVLALALPFAAGIYMASRVFGRRARDAQRSAGRAAASVLAHLNETGQVSVAVRALNLGERLEQRMHALLNESNTQSLRTLDLSNARSLVQSLLGLLLILCAMLACAEAHTRGQLTVGQAGAVISLLMVIMRNFVLVIELLNTVELGFVSIERMNQYAELISEDALGPGVAQEAGVSAVTKESGPVAPQESSVSASESKTPILQISNLSVRYNPSTPFILRNLDASLTSRGMVGIIGRTGSGKSTLISVLLRFTTLESGRILLRGRDLSALPIEHVRRQIALVSQDPILFSGTLLSNILPRECNGLSSENSQELVDRARGVLQIVGLSDWVSQLPEGLDTEVLERGLNLSQGQRQLLCLARALAQDPQILILDEATSAVDPELERLISAALQRIRTRIPVLLIAHRPATIQSCDEVWLLKGGRFVWKGHPSDIPPQEVLE